MIVIPQESAFPAAFWSDYIIMKNLSNGQGIGSMKIALGLSFNQKHYVGIWLCRSKHNSTGHMGDPVLFWAKSKVSSNESHLESHRIRTAHLRRLGVLSVSALVARKTFSPGKNQEQLPRFFLDSLIFQIIRLFPGTAKNLCWGIFFSDIFHQLRVKSKIVNRDKSRAE